MRFMTVNDGADPRLESLLITMAPQKSLTSDLIPSTAAAEHSPTMCTWWGGRDLPQVKNFKNTDDRLREIYVLGIHSLPPPDQAVCKTIVPDTFGVLLSQRRRWINSMVHNLFELLFVRDLCGTFCFSMRFVVFMELAGTLVLTAAISFTLYLISSIIPGGPDTTIPLILLAIILGIPGVMIVVTSRKVAYVGWMLIYLLSLPIWNFVLPTYAFWHFDDFNWGQTRMVMGDKAGASHADKEGEFDSSHIVMKRWAEFERERRWRNSMQSRDSMFYDMRSNSPKRKSTTSTSETFQQSSPDMSDSYMRQRLLAAHHAPRYAG